MVITRVTRNFRITIPKEVREKMNIKKGDSVRISVEGGKMIIEKLFEDVGGIAQTSCLRTSRKLWRY